MCARYQFTASECADILRIIRAIDQKYGDQAWTQGEVFPTATAPVLVSAGGNVTPELFFWGFRLPHTLIINARAETADQKPLFRDDLALRRCVIPTTGFFEWDSVKRKYLFTLPDSPLLCLAGIYAIRDGKRCFCILTTAANESMKGVHDRMPLVLTEEQTTAWLNQPEAVRDLLHTAPPPLEKEATDSQISLW